MAKSKLVNANNKIADFVVSGYKKIEEGVVGAYKKVEDSFVDQFLTHADETVEDAKKRLSEEQSQREAAAKEAMHKPAIVQAGTDAGRASMESSLGSARASVEASRKPEKH